MNLIRLLLSAEYRHHHPALHSFSFSIYESVQSITTCYITNYWLRKEKFNKIRTSKFLSDETYKRIISRSHRSFLSIICYLIVAISLLYIDDFTHSNRTIRIKIIWNLSYIYLLLKYQLWVNRTKKMCDQSCMVCNRKEEVSVLRKDR